MLPAGEKPSFERISLKYKSLDAFSKAARTTFSKGRMTVKSRKGLKENERIILAITIQDVEKQVEIICDIIQKVPAEEEGKPNTYGVRWCNFTEKKLSKLIQETKTGEEKQPQEPKPEPERSPKQKPEKPEQQPAPEPEHPSPEPEQAAPPPPPSPELEPEKPKPTTAPEPNKQPAPEKLEQESAPPQSSEEQADSEYTIDLEKQGGEYPSFMEPGGEERTAHSQAAADKGEEMDELSEDADTSLDVQPIPAEPAHEDTEEAVPVPAPAGSEQDEPWPAEPETSEPGTGQAEEPESPAQQEQPAREQQELAPEPAEEVELPAKEDFAPPREQEAAAQQGPTHAQEEAPVTEPAEEPEEVPLPPPPPSHQPEIGMAGSSPEEDIISFSDKEQAGAEDQEAAPLQEAAEGQEDSEEPAEVQLPPPPPAPSSQPYLADQEAKEQAEEHDMQGTAETAEQEQGETPVEQEIARQDSAPAPEQEPELPPEEVPGPEGPEEGPEELPGKERLKPLTEEELEQLGYFLAKLLKLLSQPDKALDKESAGNVKATYEEFKELMSGREEVGVYMRSAGAVREFMLAGDFQGPVNLKTSMPGELFDELALKLVEFFESKGLMGLQFRRYLTEDAFRGLIGKMGHYDPSEESPDQLASGLLQEGAFHATPVHASDRISGASNLDFQVDMTLARMRGDLVRLPIVAEAIEEAPAALMTLRVEDALKAMQTGPFRAELLINAHNVVEGQDQVTEPDLVQEIILATPVDMLSDAAGYLADQYEKLLARAEDRKDDQETNDLLERVKRVMRQAAARLTVEDPDAASQVMGGLYRKGVFTLEELPPELRDQVMIEQFIEFFKQDPEKRLDDFAGITSEKDYKNAAKRYVRMVAELARQGDAESADLIFKAIVDHVRTKDPGFTERQQLAREALSVLTQPMTLNSLVLALGRVDKSKREQVAAFIFAAGPAAAGRLIEQLEKDEDRSVRRLICEILTRMGERVVPELQERLKDLEAPWYLVRNMVMILADMKSPVLSEDLDWYLSHDHARVREEALVYAAKVSGTESESTIVRMLSDPDPGVRRRAVRVLARFPDLGDAAVLRVAEMIETQPPKEASQEEEQAVAAACELIGKLGNRAIADGRSMEHLLAAVLEQESGKGLLGRLTGPKSNRTPRMKAALIEALGKVGTQESRKLLSSFAKDKDPAVKESAQKAMTKLAKAGA